MTRPELRKCRALMPLVPPGLGETHRVDAHSSAFVVDSPLLGLHAGLCGCGKSRMLELGRGYARVVTTRVRIARVAGHLLASIGAGSDMAIDPLLVATAVRLGGGVILTHDPADLERLAAGQPNVRVVAV